MNYFIGVDVGTSATKSVLFDENGSVIASDSQSYELKQPHNGWAQQNPMDWKNAVIKTIKEISSQVDAESIRAVGVSGQMHGLVILDQIGDVLYDSIIWCDQRTQKEVDKVISVLGKQKYIDLTLNAPNTSFTLFKLLWLQNNEPDIFSNVRKVLLPKDYVNFVLTGKYATDVSDASGTGYFDVKNRRWSGEILNTFGIDEELLPNVYESSQVIGNITEDIARQTGLSTSTLVVAGAGDQAAAAVGNGVVKTGSTSVSLGTSGVVFTALEKPDYDKQGRTHTFCHAVPNMWHIMSVTQGCGLSVDWFKQTFAKNLTYEQLDKNAADISADGIIYLPYLMGERTPHLDSNCRASFTGVCVNHNVYNFYRAVLEGVCFSFKDCINVFGDNNISTELVKVCGGGAKSRLWLKILSDVLHKDIYTSDDVESGALGVAILAAVGYGFYNNISQAYEEMSDSILTKVKFSDDNAEYYDTTYEVFKKLYKAIECARKR